jgi:DNA (cytosine-5)-methyltransferase 1
MTAYYNENDEHAADWLENLIKQGEIAPGIVDRRSIEDVRPDELSDFTQCHFFAGIGIWSAALRAAGWDDDRPVWTGSCPCQPFSASGEGKGFLDPRHLWPAWFWHIEHGKPRGVPVIGEQVASKDGLAWLDLVFVDMEKSGHALWTFDLCSAGFGSPNIRQRLYFAGVADTDSGHLSQPIGGQDRRNGPTAADAKHQRPGPLNGFWRNADWLFCRDGKWRAVEPGTFPLVNGDSFKLGSGGPFEGKSRAQMLKGYGNAINLEVATGFVRDVMAEIG